MRVEGYQPLQTRREAGVKQQPDEVGKAAAAASTRRAPAVAAGRVSKPKRGAPKRIDLNAWRSDAEDSQGSDAPSVYMTDDSAASRRASARLAAAPGLLGMAALATAAPLEERGPAGEREREPSVRAAAAASRLKLSYITSQSQLAKEQRGPNTAAGRAVAMQPTLSLRLEQQMPAQSRELGSAALSSIAGAFFASSLRLKPRKPLVVKVAAVW
ncbi:hypothetical protein ABPG77_010833 [Micractinium sp. CCAP 211/92]